MKNLTLAALGLVVLTAIPASAADWSDTYLRYRTGTKFQETGIQDPIKKDIYSLAHVSGYSLGTNFFNVDLLKSDLKDPANTAGDFNGKGSNGAQEVYVVYRTNLSLEKVFSTKMSGGIVRDVEFTAGIDYNTKNTTFAPSVFKVLAGPTVAFQVPGFLTLGVLYYNEKNHNGYATFPGEHINVSFDPTYQVAAAWGINAKLGPVNTLVKGYGTYTGAKGKDGGGVKTVPETLINIWWMFDASPLVGAKKGTWQIGPGFEYWDAKFGDPTYKTKAAAQAATASTGVFTSVNPQVNAFMLAVEYHF